MSLKASDLFLGNTGPADYGSADALFQEVRDFIHVHFDYPDEKAYDVFASWILATYRLDEWQAMPFLFFLGMEGSGKTRALEVIQHLANNAFLVANITSAAVFRMDEVFHPTFCLDESEYLAQEDKTEIIGLVNTRYRKTGKVIRVAVDKESGEKTLETFSVYGFTALAGTREMIQTLKSRCIVFHMTPSNRRLRMFMNQAWALQLRNKLTKYSTDFASSVTNIANTSEEVRRSEEPEGVYVTKYLGQVFGRDAELFYPLLVCAPDIANSPSPKLNVVEFAKSYIALKIKERSTEGDALVYAALVEMRTSISKSDNPDVITLKEVVGRLNSWLPEKEGFKSQTVGKLLRSMGFEVKVSTGGMTVVKYNQVVVDRLASRYTEGGGGGIPPQAPHSTSLPHSEVQESQSGMKEFDKGEN